jgi:hypothetical protein
MNLASVLSAGGGNTFRTRKGPFRSANLGPLPFLVTAKPVDLAPTCLALGTGVTAKQGWDGVGLAGKVEGFILILVATLFVVVAFVSALGAQHISYVRAKNQLGRQLRQKEYELIAVTRAYWSLQAENAIQVAQGLPSAGAQVANAISLQKGTTKGVLRADTPPCSRSAPATVGRVQLPLQRSPIADVRNAARRGGVRS